MDKRLSFKKISDSPLLAGVELGGTKCIAVLAHGSKIIQRHTIATDYPELDSLPCTAHPDRSMVPRPRLRCDRHRQLRALGPRSQHPRFWPYHANDQSRMVGCAGVLSADRRSQPACRHHHGRHRSCVGRRRMGRVPGAAYIYLNRHRCWRRDHYRWRSASRRHTYRSGPCSRISTRDRRIFAGVCAFHGDCLEGLVSGPAIAARTAQDFNTLRDDDPVWATVAAEIAELIAMLILTLAPHRIVIGGGVPQRRPALIPAIRTRTAMLLDGYQATYMRML